MPREKRRTAVIIDSREPYDVRLAVSARLDEEPDTVALPCADFLLVDPDACMLGIERKTISDFLASLADGRLRSQLPRMKAAYPLQGLILEGSYSLDGEGFLTVGIRTGWTHAAFQMTLYSIQRQFPDLMIFWTQSLGATADVIRALANRGKTKGCFDVSTLFAEPGLKIKGESGGDPRNRGTTGGAVPGDAHRPRHSGVRRRVSVGKSGA